MEEFINQSAYVFTKDLLTFLFTSIGLIIAGIGLATWKRQVRGIKEFDIAYDLHYAVLKLRDAIKYVRNPFISLSESSKAVQYAKLKYPDKSEEAIEKDASSSVYEMRWEEITSASTEMESHLLAAEVIWGKDILELIKPLNKQITELNIALKQNFQPEMRTKNTTEIHDIIYDKGNWGAEEDAFSRTVTKPVRNITDYIKNKIS